MTPHDDLMLRIYREGYVPTQEEYETLAGWSARRMASFGVTPDEARRAALRAVVDAEPGTTVLANLATIAVTGWLDDIGSDDWMAAMEAVHTLLHALGALVLDATARLYPMEGER